MSVRLAVAGTAVLSEADALRARGRDLDGLSRRHRLAVAFAEDLMTQPGQMSARLINGLHDEFTDRQLVELTLKVLKFNQQKVTVALGADVTVTSENILDMAWAADGSFVAAPSA